MKSSSPCVYFAGYNGWKAAKATIKIEAITIDYITFDGWMCLICNQVNRCPAPPYRAGNKAVPLALIFTSRVYGRIALLGIPISLTRPG